MGWEDLGDNVLASADAEYELRVAMAVVADEMKAKMRPLLWNSGTSAPDSVHSEGGLDFRLTV